MKCAHWLVCRRVRLGWCKFQCVLCVCVRALWGQLSVQTINVIRVAGLELMRSLIGEFNVEDPRNISIDQFAQEQRSRFLAHILRSSSWQTYAMQCVRCTECVGCLGCLTSFLLHTDAGKS